jgi:hypothetical protein
MEFLVEFEIAIPVGSLRRRSQRGRVPRRSPPPSSWTRAISSGCGRSAELGWARATSSVSTAPKANASWTVSSPPCPV